MKNQIIIFFVLFSINASSQCLTRKYENIAKKVFNGTLKTSDFKVDDYTKMIFVTVDTVSAYDLTVPSKYYELTDPNEAIKIFNETLKSVKIEGSYFNYYEIFDNEMFGSPVHISFLINNQTYTFKVDIWTNSKDVNKIRGLTIYKYDQKLNRTPY